MVRDNCRCMIPKLDNTKMRCVYCNRHLIPKKNIVKEEDE